MPEMVTQTVPDCLQETEWLTNVIDVEPGMGIINLNGDRSDGLDESDDKTVHEVLDIDGKMAAIMLDGDVYAWVNLRNIHASASWVAVAEVESASA